MKIVFFGLTITSSWGNGHASTYRSLLKGLHQRGHELTFYEHNVEWYVSNRDLPTAPYASIRSFDDWRRIRAAAIGEALSADLVIVGSYFPDGVQALDELLGRQGPLIAFYDIDTPITLQQLCSDACPYLRRNQMVGVDLYLSFTGGPLLREIERQYAVRRARPLYCSCDPDRYFPEHSAAYVERKFSHDFGYMGTYSDDRQPKLWQLLMRPARRLPGQRFVVAGLRKPL